MSNICNTTIQNLQAQFFWGISAFQLHCVFFRILKNPTFWLPFFRKRGFSTFPDFQAFNRDRRYQWTRVIRLDWYLRSLVFIKTRHYFSFPKRRETLPNWKVEPNWHREICPAQSKSAICGVEIEKAFLAVIDLEAKKKPVCFKPLDF